MASLQAQLSGASRGYPRQQIRINELKKALNVVSNADCGHHWWQLQYDDSRPHKQQIPRRLIKPNFEHDQTSAGTRKARPHWVDLWWLDDKRCVLQIHASIYSGDDLPKFALGVEGQRNPPADHRLHEGKDNLRLHYWLVCQERIHDHAETHDGIWKGVLIVQTFSRSPQNPSRQKDQPEFVTEQATELNLDWLLGLFVWVERAN